MLRCAVWLFAVAAPLAAQAQTEAPALKTELDALYRELLQDPSDRELNRRMIRLAVELKDYDAAIGAVERLIFYEPDDIDLQIQAAQLYFAIQSYAAATGYLKEVLARPQLDDAFRRRASELTARIDAATRPSIWAAYVQAGVRHQSNANVGPAELGADAQFPSEPPTPDWNSFALGTVALAAPVGKNVVIEGSLSGYYADQFEVDRLDLGFAEITGGPRFQTEDGTFSIKPFGLVQGILLGSDPYQRAVGGGASARVLFEDGWFLEPQFEYKSRTYFNSDDYEAATDQTGDLFTFSSSGGGRFSDNFSWVSEIAFAQNEAAENYQSYEQVAARLSPRFDFELFGREGWSFSPFGSVIVTDYADVAPAEVVVGFDTVRSDFQWNVGVELVIPLLEQAGLQVQVEYTDNQSNLDRFTYENVQVLAGPFARF